jgi:lysophospholipase L1-like esterase
LFSNKVLKYLIFFVSIFAAVILSLFFEVIVALRDRGEKHLYSEPVATSFGDGKKISYVIMGDSTSAGVGGVYENGVAIATAKHLGRTYETKLINLSVPGARINDILKDQLPQALVHTPDVILIVAGANDVTHLTRIANVKNDLRLAINHLIEKNCKSKIILMGSPQMATVPRFGSILRGLARLQTYRLNKSVKALVVEKDLTFAPVAEQTSEQFSEDPIKFFAEDKFHPSDEGYGLWAPVLNDAIDDAMMNQPTHC